MKKLTAMCAALLLAFLPVCAVFAEAAEAPAGWEEILSGLEGVMSVERVPLEEGEQFCNEKYLVTFAQPLDWRNPDAGTFPQRVLVGLRDGAQVNVLRTEGYALVDMILGDGSDSLKLLGMPNREPDTAQMLEGNYIQAEHRFFGKSRPEDLSNDGTAYWEYLTAENAANDYHRIRQALAPVLGSRWIATGSSRGGDLTLAYGYYFPEDMDVYVPYVAPGAMVRDDPRFYSFVFTGIGDAAFGAEEAGKMRELLLSFQVMMMKHKPELLAGFEENARSLGCEFRPQVGIETIYDLCVLEFAALFWQYRAVPFEEVRQLMDMPETAPEELRSKLDAGLSVLLQIQSPADYSVSSWAWPYYVGAATTYGQYRYDFSFLRQALKDAGAEEMLSVAEGAEDDLFRRIMFTEEQQAAFVYDGSWREAMQEALKTTGAKYLMVFGAADPWFSMGIAECDNPNVKIFVHPTLPHSAAVRNLPEEMRTEAAAWLNECLGR